MKHKCVNCDNETTYELCKFMIKTEKGFKYFIADKKKAGKITSQLLFCFVSSSA